MDKRYWLLLLLPWVVAVSIVPAAQAAPYPANSCNYSDVNAVINGPTHTAVDGDTILIPAGSCAWTAGITVPSGVGLSILGAGQGATVLTDDIASGASLFYLQPVYGSSLSRVSSMTLTPASGITFGPQSCPLSFSGSCTPSGCPNIRVDHITFPSGWSGTVVSLIVTENVFGVIDHNTVNAATASGNELVNVGFNSWQGVGQNGDNGMAAPDTFGTAQAIYIEDNSLSGNVDAVETEVGVEGGSRVVGRFNTFTNAWSYCGFSNHGTETDGRPRSSRQFEIYGNSFQTANTTNGSGGTACFRGGVDIQFGNTMTAESGAWFNQYFGLTTERTYRPTVWGLCDGFGAYDVNDGATTAWTGTIASVGSGTLSVAGTPWTAGAYTFSTSNPGSLYYVIFDQTNGELGGIANNTSSTLTLSWTGGGFTGQSFAAGDSMVILGSTLYAAGTMTGASGSGTLTDNTKNWTANQWYVPGDDYSILDVTQGNATQIYGNTSNTITLDSGRYPGWNWNNGDQYAILRASKCFDSVCYAGGSLMSGYVPAPLSTFESSDPCYEFADTGTPPLHGYVSSDNLNIMADRDYYGEVSPSPQTSAASPFNGTSGTGYGPLAYRPTSCTPYVGYWATDQGNWNQSGNGFGQGELFVCTSPNIWTLYYEPYVYPHPLVSGTATPPPPATTTSGFSPQVYPNPWRSDRGYPAQITFDQLTGGNTTIKIFTVSGHLVKTLSTQNSGLSTVTWNLTNDSGDRVASGIYLYVITDTAGDKARGKVAIIR